MGVNIVELNSEGYFLSGHPAGRIMTTTDANGTFKIMGLAMFVNDAVCTISYTANPSTYNQNLPDVQSIIDSFKIISSQ